MKSVIIYNYKTSDEYFKVVLPVEFELLFLKPSEVKYHKDQILKHNLVVYDNRIQRDSYRPLCIDEISNRVYFTYRINKHVKNKINPIYYLDELIKIK